MRHCPLHDDLACGIQYETTCADCRTIYFPVQRPEVHDLRENLIRLLGVIPRELSTKEKTAEIQRLANLAFSVANDFEFAADINFGNQQLRLMLKLKAELIKEMRQAALAIAQDDDTGDE